jgi:dephospho-CoA kinase
MVVGLTGANAAGKGAVADYLRGRGFRVHSLSDIVREEAARRGLEPDREHLIRIGTELRRRGGAGVLAEAILPRLGERDVVDSIRNPAEVATLRVRPDFVLLGVRAPVELRFARAVARRRPGDPESLDDFRARERQENTADPAAQQLEATFALADRILENDADLPALHAALERWLGAPG